MIKKYGWFSFFTLSIACFLDIYFKIDFMNSIPKIIIAILILFGGVFAGMTYNRNNASCEDGEVKE